jgi:hypothetical protein
MTRRSRKLQARKTPRNTAVRRATAKTTDLVRDPLYRAKGVGRSKDGRSASDHDEFLYGWRRR